MQTLLNFDLCVNAVIIHELTRILQRRATSVGLPQLKTADQTFLSVEHRKLLSEGEMITGAAMTASEDS